MKRLLLFLIPVILISCDGPKQDSTQQDSIGGVSTKSAKEAIKADASLQSIIDANVHNQPQIDTACLGFTFGMTKEQAIAHFNQLVKEKKLVRNEQDQRYEYPMVFEMAKANAVIAPEFQDNKLYRVSLVISSAEEAATEETIYLQAATTYMKKYSDYKLIQEPDVVNPNDKQFHWIKNNLQIFLHQTVQGTVAEYTNMLAAKGLDKQNKIATDSSKAQTSKDI